MFHYNVVIYKNKSGIKINDLNNINNKFITYENLKNFANIVLKIEPIIKNINYKMIKTTGILNSVDLYEFYLKNKIISALIIIFLCFSIILNIGSAFYAYWIFSQKNINNLLQIMIIVILFLSMIITNIIAKFSYERLILLFQQKISSEIKKNFYHEIIYKKIIKHKSISKHSYFKIQSETEEIINYASRWIFDIILITLIISFIFLIFIINREYLIILIVIIFNIIYWATNKIIKKNINIYIQDYINIRDKINKNNINVDTQKIQKKKLYIFFQKLNNDEEKARLYKYKIDKINLWIYILNFASSLILTFILITVLFFLNYDFKIIILTIILSNYSFLAFKKLNSFIKERKNIIKIMDKYKKKENE